MSNQDTTVNDPTDNNEMDREAESPRADANKASPDQSKAEGSTEPTVEIPPHEHEMTQLRAERDQLEQKLQRAMADTQNIRRRQKQEMDDSRRRVLEGLTQELLPVLDSFTLALQAYDDSNSEESSEGATSAPVARVRVRARVERPPRRARRTSGPHRAPPCRGRGGRSLRPGRSRPLAWSRSPRPGGKP